MGMGYPFTETEVSSIINFHFGDRALKAPAIKGKRHADGKCFWRPCVSRTPFLGRNSMNEVMEVQDARNVINL